MMFPVKLLKYENAQLSGGEWDDDQTPVEYKVFAEVLKGSGSRFYDHQTILGQTKKFRMYFRDDLDLDGNWKIKWRGKEWTVTDIEQEDERRFHWILTATHK